MNIYSKYVWLLPYESGFPATPGSGPPCMILGYSPLHSGTCMSQLALVPTFVQVVSSLPFTVSPGSHWNLQADPMWFESLQLTLPRFGAFGVRGKHLAAGFISPIWISLQRLRLWHSRLHVGGCVSHLPSSIQFVLISPLRVYLAPHSKEQIEPMWLVFVQKTSPFCGRMDGRSGHLTVEQDK